MRRQVAGVVLVAVATTVLFAAVSTSGGVGLWQEPQWELSSSEVDDEATAPTTAAPTLPDTEVERQELPGWTEALIQVLAVAICFAGAVALLRVGWQRRPRLRWRRRPRHGFDGEVLPDVAVAVVDDAEAQRAELLTGTPRNAIVRCWLRLEGEVAGAGLPRDPAETSTELTERVLARYTVDAGAIRDLGALYREARFSEHELDESARRAALDALDRLHRALAAPDPVEAP